MKSFVVYHTSDDHWGYRSLGSERSPETREIAGNRLMSGMIGRGEAHQTWMIDARSGDGAISRVKKILKAQALK